MSYAKQTWTTGETITAEKLNHIEDGLAGAGGILVITLTVSGDTTTMDKTWQEIWDAFNDGKMVIAFMYDTDEDYTGKRCMFASYVFSSESNYGVELVHSSGSLELSTTTASGYPSRTAGAVQK